MKTVSLASGSKGNAYLVGCGDDWLMIDCGVSCRTLVCRAAQVGVDPARIRAVLFTHDHDDHVGGLATFHRHFPQAELFANDMTAEAIAAATGVALADFAIFTNGQPFAAGPFTATAFSVPHDVPDPVGYLVTAGGFTYFHATDCGSPLASVGERLRAADAATLESNYDPVLVRGADRPEHVKRRVMGPRGHLANADAAELVRRYASPKLKRLALAHLSQQCNAPHLAEREMRAALAEMGRGDIELEILAQDAPGRVFSLTAQESH